MRRGDFVGLVVGLGGPTGQNAQDSEVRGRQTWGLSKVLRASKKDGTKGRGKKKA